MTQLLGFHLPRETMANWFIKGAEEYFEPIYERMHKDLLIRDLLFADETTTQVLREEGKTSQQVSYFWIYRTGQDNKPKIILYEYQDSRRGECVSNFLSGFHGILECDGYQAYGTLEDVILVC